jgi:hypothetical protein
MSEEKVRIEDAIRQKADEAVMGEPVDLPEDGDDPEPHPTNEPPDWANLAPGMKLPDGWQIWFLRFRAAHTNTPIKGDRTCILWNLSEADEKHAAKRSRGDPMRVIEEMTKQTIRVVDGCKADWSGAKGPGSVDVFWTEIGGKCRHQLKSLYLKNHTMSAEENADFFGECCAVRTAG